MAITLWEMVKLQQAQQNGEQFSTSSVWASSVGTDEVIPGSEDASSP